MTGPQQNTAGMLVSGQNMPTQQVMVTNRMVSFVIYCAPLDNLNPMYAFVHPGDTSYYGVTDSASYLTRMPYVVVDADTKKVIYPAANENGQVAYIQGVGLSSALQDGARKVHALPAIRIPANVTRIALHVANDAFQHNRKFQLYPWTVENVAHSKIHIYELRSDLRVRFSSRNNLTVPSNNALLAKPGLLGEYYGYLDGDLWLQISHEFTDGDITRLCPPETLSRNAVAGSLSQSQPPSALPVNTPTQESNATPHSEGPHVYAGPITGISSSPASTPAVAQAQVVGNAEQLAVDWLTTLAPIYSAGADSRSMASFTVEIPNLAITLKFGARALANAINTSARTTVQQALRRTSPRTFAAVLKAAWRLRIDKLTFSSSWRPMLGSRLHKMGIGLDVVQLDDDVDNVHFVVNNHGAFGNHQGENHDDNPFPNSTGGQRLSRLYAELNGDGEVMHGAVYTPWMNWVSPHDTHMHITVKDD